MPAARTILGSLTAAVSRGPSKRQSISRKLSAAVGVAVLAAMAVVAVAMVWQEAARHTRSRLDFLTATASVFASASSRAVAADDVNGAYQALRGVARAPDLQYARVERLDGSPLAEIGTVVTLESDGELHGDSSLSPIAALSSRTLTVSQPVVQGGVRVGRVVLVADNSDLLPRLLITLAQGLLATLLALGIGVAVANRLKNAVVRPLVKLTEMVRHISRSHDYGSRMEIASDDEVGELCGGFNTMLSEIRDRERRITDLALHDSETDLPNRIALEREIERRIAAGRPFAVAAIGIDRFHVIRAAIGYRLANALLGELGVRTMTAASAARISTDVIGCILEVSDADAALQKGSALLLEAEAPVLLGENTLDVNISIGVALFGEHGETPGVLVENASIALDQARPARAKVHVFDAAAYAETTRNVTLVGDLLRAMRSGELSIHFQPKLDIRSGAIAGAEALARWTHPQRGAVSPDLFIGMAEETGIINIITEWVLRQAIAAQLRLAADGPPPEIAVNLSGRLLDDAAFIATARRLLDQAPGRICFEITETASIDNQEAALRNILALKDAGAIIALDDYGQGLSSLSYLRRIPAEELKIDKAFVQRLGEQQRDALLVKSTIDLAHSLGMRVTAEGVETPAALAALTAMGCDVAQGYLFARPMLEADFTRFLREHAAPPRARAV